MSMGFTSADLANLKDALVSGALEVTIGDRTVRYRSQKELLAVIELVQAELNGISSSDTDPTKIKATFSRGES